MPEYDNTNTGVLFKNKRKQEGSKQPDYQGTINIDGVEKELVAWVRKSNKGDMFMSLKFQDKREDKNKGDKPPF